MASPISASGANVFVADDKAYILSGTSQYVVWDPEAMVIVGTFDIPELPARDGLQPFPGYSDRAAIVRGHTLYQPIYYTDPDQAFFVMDGGSSLLVVDTEADEVEEVLELPCPGIDFASKDDDEKPLLLELGLRARRSSGDRPAQDLCGSDCR